MDDDRLGEVLFGPVIEHGEWLLEWLTSTGLDREAAVEIVQETFLEMVRMPPPEGTDQVEMREYVRAKAEQIKEGLHRKHTPLEAVRDALQKSGLFLKRALLAAETSAPHQRSISVYIDPGDAQSELIAELYAALDAVYRSCGGSGLRIVKQERRVLTGEVD